MGPVDLDETSREKLLVSDSFFPHSTECNLYFLRLILIFFVESYLFKGKTNRMHFHLSARPH